MENIRVIYPIVMQPSWITGEGGITQQGANYSGYVVDSRQGIWSGSSERSFDSYSLLAYPSNPSASPRNFSVSLTANPAYTQEHLRVFHYTNWSFYAAYVQPGALGYNVVPNINAQASTPFNVDLSIFNIGDADLHDVTVSVAVPANLTMTSGEASTYIGTMVGGQSQLLTYEFVPENVPAILPVTFQVSSSSLNVSQWLVFTVNVYVAEYIPPLIPPSALVLGFGVVAFLGIAYYGYKKTTSHYGAKWEPDETTGVYKKPEIAIQTLGKPGTVAELDPVESAFFVNESRQKIVSMILMSCVKKGALRVLSVDPLKVSVTGIELEELTYYEQMLVDAVVDDEFAPEKVDDLIERLADEVQKKSWQADFEATKAEHDKLAEGLGRNYSPIPRSMPAQTTTSLGPITAGLGIGST